MYTTPSPHASAVPPGTLTHPPQTQPVQGQVQHGTAGHAVPLQSAARAYAAAPVAPRPVNASTFVTGAYQRTGDPAIDRMVRFEAACKQFGTGF